MMNKEQLKRAVLRSLRKQGFLVRKGTISLPVNLDKEGLRRLHSEAVHKRVERARGDLQPHEERLLSRIASGTEVIPEAIVPRLIHVRPDTEDELLFRFARLHWSVPVSAGYGRRVRFLVEDGSNGKLIGVIGLCDPVYSIGPRDQWIGWDREAKRRRLQCVMEAFVLGAVPPYNKLLCGKLVAMLVASDEIRRAVRRKYKGRSSHIRRKALDGRLALVTTTSALGRSSIYNRLRLQGEELFNSLGFTLGSGDFHFSNGVYEHLWKYANRYCHPTAKHSWWGDGFRNRRELVRKCLPRLGLPRELVYHGVQRELFAVPLARNTRAFLRGEHQRLLWKTMPASQVFDWFRERWLLGRAKRDSSYLEFDRESYQLYATRD